MKKVGILTFHRAINYGAFLQAVALKRSLEEFGCSASFVDYWPEYHSARYFPFRREQVTSLKMFVRECFVCLFRLIMYSKFRTVQSRDMGLGTKPLYRSGKELSSVAFDSVVYGSDQIWWKDPKTGFDEVYWGSYVPAGIKKVAYAPSMGSVDISERDFDFISEHLPSFSALSSREADLSSVLSSLTGNPVPQVLDPVFLPPLSFWEEKCERVGCKKYILYYSMLPSEKADSLADSLSRQTQLPVIKIYGGLGSYHYITRYSYNSSPYKFISLIRNAEYVVSTSFHGVAFSIIFGKQFWTVDIGKRMSRISSLLHQLDLEDRIVDDANGLMPRACIDYEKMSGRLSGLRNASREFLRENI